MSGTPYTISDEKVIRELYGKVSCKIIAIRLGRDICADAILNKAKKMGLRMTAEQRKKITREYREYYHERQKEKRKRKFNGYGIDVVVGMAILDRRKAKPKTIHPFSAVWEDICDALDFDYEEAKHGRRDNRAFARHVFFYVMKRMYGVRFSQKEIVQFFGLTNHSTCIHGVKKIEDGIRVKDPDFLRDWKMYLSKTKIYK